MAIGVRRGSKRSLGGITRCTYLVGFLNDRPFPDHAFGLTCFGIELRLPGYVNGGWQDDGEDVLDDGEQRSHQSDAE